MLNCLIFAVYRVLFLARCAEGAPSAEQAHVLLYGLRLDLALLGFELCGLGLLTLLLRWLRVARLFRWLWGLTALHAFVCLSNYFTFAERSQNSGDLLLPYITSPYQIYLAVLPFIQLHGLLLAGLGVGAGFYFWLGALLARRIESGLNPVDLWSRPKTLVVALLVALLPLMMTWQPIIKQKRKGLFNGLTAIIANSKYYTHFSDFRENEAVINPLFEFVGVQLPTAFKQTIRYRETEAEALAEWQRDNIPPADAEYPLLKVIRGQAASKIENVIIIQVEGLSGSVLEQERDGKPVTPCLRKLAKSGIYFPNTFQNANFTSGGVFSTASSVPKATWEETTRRFASHELHGYYGSLAHVLGGSNYTHYFCESFRQSGDDFLSFMSYQGCKVLNYQAFRGRLEAKHQLADGDSVLGVHDGYLMQECAAMLEQCPTRFTAHLMTCTTHSPWATPPSFGAPFQEPDLNTFAYLDHSIEVLVNRIEQNTVLRDKTLIVVLGDHTSITFGKNLLERLRIPLIFYAPGLPQLRNSDAVWASQVDVLPTVLGLMPGNHFYAGMGRNLLDRPAPFTGAVSGTRDTGYFVTENWVLQYHPFHGETQLFAVTNGVAAPENMAANNPAEVQNLLHKCYARIELARRLSLSKHIYPMSMDGLHLALGGPGDKKVLPTALSTGQGTHKPNSALANKPL